MEGFAILQICIHIFKVLCYYRINYLDFLFNYLINKCVFLFLCSRTSSSNSKPLILALGDCIPVRPWSDSPIECLAEIRMIWKDKTEQCLLISLRLYFLPENTPLGRNCHGEVSNC